MSTASSKPATPQRLRHAERRLAAVDVDWEWLIATVGPCRLQIHDLRSPYEALVRAIAYQQLRARAAEAILGRLLALYPRSDFPSPRQLLRTDPQRQRDCGLSASKLAAIRGIAQGALDEVIPDRAEADTLSDAELITRLTTLRGVGRWTVEMLLIFTLGRMDVLPVDDYGVREGYRRLKRLEGAPTPRQLQALGEDWAPQRTVAAWYLWRMPVI